MSLWNTLLLIDGVAILTPMLMWSLECAAALWPPRKGALPGGAQRPRVAILVPAHNEAGGIRQTLDSLTPQILPRDRIVVIADNCTDSTAAVARHAGAEVLERSDPVRHGKSYALDFGVRALQHNPPDVVVVIDADCIAEPAAIDRIARLAFDTGRPAQANYLLEPPPGRRAHQQMASLAFLVKNLVRPAGLDRMGLPCFLNGSGMAFPWAVIQAADLASGRITEDKWLTVDLALAGHAAIFVRDARVTGRLPDQKHAEDSQRTRWLHGHMECMLVQGPRLLLGAIRQRRIDLFGLAFDLCVPPLSLLMVLWLVLQAVTVASGLFGFGWIPALLPAIGGALMASLFWGILFRFGHDEMRGALRGAPSYVLAKLPIYAAFLTRREKNWIRTGRDPLPPPD